MIRAGSGLALLTVACWSGCQAPPPAAPPPEPPPLVHWREYFSDPDLRALIDAALQGNFDLRLAAARLEALRARLAAAGGRLLPSVAGSASAGGTTPSDLVDFDYWIGFEASWEIDVWGRLRDLREAESQRFWAGVEEQRAVRTALVAHVCELYFELLAQDARRRILEDSLVVERQALEVVRVQRAVGVANELALQQFEGRIRNLETLRLEADLLTAGLESEVNALLGREAGPVPRGGVSLLEAELPLLAQEVPAEFLAMRPDVRAAERELAASRADVSAARAAFLPAVSINAFLGVQSYSASDLFESDALARSLIGSAWVPLFNRSAVQAAQDEADAVQVAALQRFRQVVAEAWLEVHLQLARIRLLDLAEQAKLAEVELQERSHVTARELFRTGRAGYLEVLAVQQEGLEARFDLVDFRKRRLQSVVALYRALGGGAEG